MMQVTRIKVTMTPWQWLEHWQMADLADDQRSYEYISTEIQRRYPGNYRIVRQQAPGRRYVIMFDDPREETMFRLRWS